VTSGNGRAASFTDLTARLAGDLRHLAQQHLELLKAELARDGLVLARVAGVVAAGGLAALVGFVLLLLALGVWVGDLIGSLPGGLALVGAALAVVGLGGAVLALRRLQRQRLVVNTLRELERDAEWIRHGV
jgi:uncharacterized membrane protein YqjE